MTPEDYDIAVAMLGRIDPTHALLPSLRAGYSRINELYLKSALNGRVEQVARPQVQRKLDAPGPDTPEFRQLMQRRASLFLRRCGLSNQFHDHPNDPVACANISDEIARVQKLFGEVLQQIAHYKLHGELIEAPEPVQREYEGLALARREATVAQNVRRWRARIEQDGPHANDITNQQWDKKLKAYERELESLRAQINAEKLHSGGL